MLRRLLRNGSLFLTQRQTSILSAAVIIMIMIAASRILGLVRNRVLAHFFTAETLSVYFAAFRLPEMVFEVLIFGALSSAFIPVFTSYLSRGQEKQAWYVASVSLNFALVFFSFLAVFLFIFAQPFYRIIAPGFDSSQLDSIVSLARILLLAQGFFILSYFLTGVLESFQRFLMPAIAPLFYNLGIIVGTLLLANRIGIYAPVFGAVVGAFLHFIIQLPLSVHLGFRPRVSLDFSHSGVREIGRLAFPRVIELFFLQIGKSAELFLASLISTAAYTYYTFANSLQLLPVGLFGVSIAKASFPTLSYQSAQKDIGQFKHTFVSLFNEIIFLTIPFSIFLAVLRVPLVRLIFGATRFTWESTIQTGYAVSAFCLGISAQALVYLLTRAFYAFRDTKTPVKISVGTMFFNVILGVIFVLILRLPIWSLAFAFSLAVILQVFLLFFFFYQRFVKFKIREVVIPFSKIVFASVLSGGLMFFFLKILDRSAWDKRLSFLGDFGLVLPVSFDRFVLDTRYTFNLIFLTAIVGIIGLVSYLLLARILGVKEIAVFAKLLTRFKRPKISVPISSE